MAWTQADLDNVRKAIASGKRSVTFADGRKIEYQNLDQLIAAERVISASLQMVSDTLDRRARKRVPYYRRGI